MKSLTIFFCSLFTACIAICFGQQNNGKQTFAWLPTLEERVIKSELVIEGRVLNTKGFLFGNGQIHTSATIKILKIFKGNISDSTIEVMLQGGFTDSLIEITTHNLGLEKDMEGIFLLVSNNSVFKLAKDLKSYLPHYGLRSYIRYAEKGRMAAPYIAGCIGESYVDLEKELFQPIERVTKIHRKVLAPNMFEREAAKVLKTK